MLVIVILNRLIRSSPIKQSIPSSNSKTSNWWVSVTLLNCTCMGSVLPKPKTVELLPAKWRRVEFVGSMWILLSSTNLLLTRDISAPVSKSA